METQTLTLHNLSFTRNGAPIFKNFSARAPQGEALIIQGANGSGKSTLLKMVAGLLSPQEGSIRLGGVPLPKKMIAYLGHKSGLPEDLTVFEYLTFENIAKKKAEQWGMTSLLTQPISTLSMGQKKRLRLLSLLKRKVWLLDEPFSHLDDAGKKLATQTINDHLKEGGMAIIATHEPLALFKSNTQTLGAQHV